MGEGGPAFAGHRALYMVYNKYEHLEHARCTKRLFLFQTKFARSAGVPQYAVRGVFQVFSPCRRAFSFDKYFIGCYNSINRGLPPDICLSKMEIVRVVKTNENKFLSTVLDELLSLKPPIRVGSDTVKKYRRAGLAPGPVESGGGRGHKAEFPFTMAAEIAASYHLLNKWPFQISFQVLAKARKKALYIEKCGYLNAKDLKDDAKLARMIKDDDLMAFIASKWLQIKLITEEQLYDTWETMEKERDQAILDYEQAEKDTDAEKKAFNRIRKVLHKLFSREFLMHNVPSVLVDITLESLPIKNIPQIILFDEWDDFEGGFDRIIELSLESLQKSKRQKVKKEKV